MTGEESEGSGHLKIVHGRVDSLSLYEITDYELQILEDGSFGATYLNFAIFFLSAAIAFLTALTTGAILPDRTFTVFVVVVAVGFSAGVVLLFLWFRTRRSMSKVLQRIKDRCAMPDPETDASLPQPLEASEESAG